ncbi:hypothetical protein [uncultured Nostoc sp.]|uniref:hypothetical protein n=1 Tax=uncultured Nostoc sp. TaxID=340711 RepID=UPI0035C9BF80
MNCTLDDYLKVVIPYLSSELVSLEGLSHIRSLTKILPPLSPTILECRLGVEQSRVDFGVDLLPTTLTLSKSFLIHPTWQAFQQICREWTDSPLLWYATVIDLVALCNELDLPDSKLVEQEVAKKAATWEYLPRKFYYLLCNSVNTEVIQQSDTFNNPKPEKVLST